MRSESYNCFKHSYFSLKEPCELCVSFSSILNSTHKVNLPDHMRKDYPLKQIETKLDEIIKLLKEMK